MIKILIPLLVFFSFNALGSALNQDSLLFCKGTQGLKYVDIIPDEMVGNGQILIEAEFEGQDGHYVSYSASTFHAFKYSAQTIELGSYADATVYLAREQEPIDNVLRPIYVAYYQGAWDSWAEKLECQSLID